jgi:hypothetical protein
MLNTIIDKNTGQELRAQFHNEISENEMIIEELRTEFMENPYWDFDKKIFYDKTEKR